MQRSMASIGFTLVVVSSGATRRLLPRYHMLFGFGARGQSVHYFFDMRDSCTRHHAFAVLNSAHLVPPYSGAIGAWIKNIDGDRESDTGET
jgi:hypothetical protein